MCASAKHALRTFEPSRLEVRWQSRAANAFENLWVIVRGPREVRGLHTRESFFRLQAPSANRRGWELAGSLVCHAFLVFAVVAISRVAPAAAPLPLPEVQITWYGPAKDVLPKTTPLPKQTRPKDQARPARLRQQIVTRGYNPDTTVVFQPPHATNRRQLLIQSQAPPRLPKILPAMPNVIQWAPSMPASPAIAIHANQLRALRGKESEQAKLRAPRITYQTPQGSMGMLPNSNATVAPPTSLPPRAIHGVRVATHGESAAAAPTLGNVVPAGGARLALAGGTNAAPGLPLPGALGVIHATRAAAPHVIAADAPTVGNVAPTGGAHLSFAQGTGAAPAPPLPGALGAIHATRAAAPHVAVQGNPSIGASSLGASTLYLPATSGSVPLPALPSGPKAVRARSSKWSGSNTAAPSVGTPTDRLVSLSLSPGSAPPPPGNAYAPMSIGPHPGSEGHPANPNLAGTGESGEAPGFPGPQDSATGPKDLLILHNGNTPAPPPAPQPVAPALRKPARVAPKPVAAAIPHRLAPAKKPANPAIGHSRSHFVPRPISVANNVLLIGVVRQDLANRTIGPWSMPTLAMNLPKLSDSRGSWVLDFEDPMPAALRDQNNVIVPLPNRAVEPQYPATLQQEGVRGKVVLRAVIGTKGRVSQIRLTESLNPVLDHLAEVAFSHWKFDPALLNNKPIAMPVIVTVPFHYVPTPH